MVQRWQDMKGTVFRILALTASPSHHSLAQARVLACGLLLTLVPEDPMLQGRCHGASGEVTHGAAWSASSRRRRWA